MIAYLRGDLPREALETMRKNDRYKLTALRISPLAYRLLMCLYRIAKK